MFLIATMATVTLILTRPILKVMTMEKVTLI